MLDSRRTALADVISRRNSGKNAAKRQIARRRRIPDLYRGHANCFWPRSTPIEIRRRFAARSDLLEERARETSFQIRIVIAALRTGGAGDVDFQIERRVERSNSQAQQSGECATSLYGGARRALHRERAAVGRELGETARLPVAVSGPTRHGRLVPAAAKQTRARSLGSACSRLATLCRQMCSEPLSRGRCFHVVRGPNRISGPFAPARRPGASP
jgi:hypothetical protein